jgi:hypothetical protein
MAEFGTQATQLSAPQGAGANVVAPTTVNPLEGLTTLISQGASLFSSLTQKDDNASVKQYTQKLSAITEGVASGQLSPEKARVQQRALYSEYAKNFPDKVEDFTKVTKSFREASNLGDVEEAAKIERDIRKTALTNAQQDGFLVFGNEEQQDKIIQNHAAVVRARKDLEAMYRANEESRASKRFQNEEEKEADKNRISQTLNVLGASNLSAFSSEMEGLVAHVTSGKMGLEQAELLRSKRFSEIQATLNAVTGTMPELGNAYRALFNDLNETSKRLLDPKTRAETSASALQDILARAQITVLSNDKKVLSAAVANRLLPNTVTATIASEGLERNIFVLLGANTPEERATNPAAMPVPIGTAAGNQVTKLVEKQVTEAMASKDDAAKDSAVKAANNLLTDIGASINSPFAMKPDALKDVANFIASPAFGQLVAEGKVSPEGRTAAARVLQISFQQPTIQAVNEKLSAPIVTLKGKSNLTAKDVVNVEWSGSGIRFTPKTDNPNIPQFEQMAYARELQSAERAINSLIRQGAHLTGSTNYKQAWEAMQSRVLPQFFPQEEQKGSTIENAPATSNSKGSVGDALQREYDRLVKAGKPSWLSQEAYDSQLKIIKGELDGAKKGSK